MAHSWKINKKLSEKQPFQALVVYLELNWITDLVNTTGSREVRPIVNIKSKHACKNYSSCICNYRSCSFP